MTMIIAFLISGQNAMKKPDTDYEIYFDNGESGLFCELWIPVKKN